MKKKIGSLDDLKLNKAKSYSVDIGELLPLELFVIYHHGQVFAYVNSCPHIGAALDWMPDQFLNDKGTHIQCSNHDAHFEIETGVCISGPCTGKKLQPLSVVLLEDEIILEANEKIRILKSN